MFHLGIHPPCTSLHRQNVGWIHSSESLGYILHLKIIQNMGWLALFPSLDTNKLQTKIKSHNMLCAVPCAVYAVLCTVIFSIAMLVSQREGKALSQSNQKVVCVKCKVKKKKS